MGTCCKFPLGSARAKGYNKSRNEPIFRCAAPCAAHTMEQEGNNMSGFSKWGLMLGAAGALGLGAALWGEGVRFAAEYEQANGTVREDGGTLQTLSLPKRNRIKYIDPLDAAALDEGLLYFGHATCPYCRNMVPVMLQLAEDQGRIIQYVCTEQWRDVWTVQDGVAMMQRAGGPGYDACLARYDACLPEYLLKDETGREVPVGEKRIYVPLVLHVAGGRVVGSWTTDDVDPTLLPRDKYEVWTPEQCEAVRMNMVQKLVL